MNPIAGCYACPAERCDEVQTCYDQHFDTETEFQACITAAELDIADCELPCDDGINRDDQRTLCDDNCQSAEDAATAAMLDTLDTCLSDCAEDDDCSGPYNTGLTACNQVYTDCLSGGGDPTTCGEELTKCNAAVEAARIACQDSTDPPLAACAQACASGIEAAFHSIQSTYHYCVFDCETVWETQPENSALYYNSCARFCCQAGEESPDKCRFDCSDEVNNCLLSAIDPGRSCMRGCLALWSDDNWSIPSPHIYNQCIFDCRYGMETGINDCNVENPLCLGDCGVTYEEDNKCCFYGIDRAYLDCETTFAHAERDCHDVEIDTLIGCDQAWDLCQWTCQIACEDSEDPDCFGLCILAADCNGVRDACQAAAPIAYDDCLVDPTQARYDCRFQACEDGNGTDPMATWYAHCWGRGEANCAELGMDDCRDALNACLATYEGEGFFYTEGDNPDEIAASCNNCGTVAWT